VAAVSRGFTSHSHARAHSQESLRYGVDTWAREGRGSRRLSLRFVNAVRHKNRASARAAASASDVHESGVAGSHVGSMNVHEGHI
jgi:hypothetical protein